jgi:hypothetical protein
VYPPCYHSIAVPPHFISSVSPKSKHPNFNTLPGLFPLCAYHRRTPMGSTPHHNPLILAHPSPMAIRQLDNKNFLRILLRQLIPSRLTLPRPPMRRLKHISFSDIPPHPARSHWNAVWKGSSASAGLDRDCQSSTGRGSRCKVLRGRQTLNARNEGHCFRPL